jgi:hypothetical protein
MPFNSELADQFVQSYLLLADVYISCTSHVVVGWLGCGMHGSRHSARPSQTEALRHNCVPGPVMGLLNPRCPHVGTPNPSPARRTHSPPCHPCTRFSVHPSSGEV